MEQGNQLDDEAQQPAAGLGDQQPQTGLPQSDDGVAPGETGQITAEQYLESANWGDDGAEYDASEVPEHIFPEVQAEFANRHPEEARRRDLRYSDYQNKSRAAAEAQRQAGMEWDRQRGQYVPITAQPPLPTPGIAQPGPLAPPPRVPQQQPQAGQQYPQGPQPPVPQAPAAAPQFQFPGNTVEGITERARYEAQQAVAPVIQQTQQLAASMEQERNRVWVEGVVTQAHALAEKTPMLQEPGAVDELLTFMDQNGIYNPEQALWAWKGKEMAQQIQAANTQAQQQNAQEPPQPPPSSGGPGQLPPATSNAELTARMTADLKRTGVPKIPLGRTT